MVLVEKEKNLWRKNLWELLYEKYNFVVKGIKNSYNFPS